MPQVIGVDHPNYILKALKEGQKEGGYTLHSPLEQLEGQDWNSMLCEIETLDFFATFQLQQMPGCCAVLVLSYIKTYMPFPQEFMDRTIEIVEKAAFNAGFGSVIMTQVVPASFKDWNKEPWYLCLKRGWECRSPFRNAKSGNRVMYLTKDLKQRGKRPELEIPVFEE